MSSWGIGRSTPQPLQPWPYREHVADGTERKRREAKSENKMIERRAEVVPRRRTRSGIVRRKEKCQHVDEPADARRSDQEPKHESQADGQLPVRDEECDGGPVGEDEPAQHWNHERIGATFDKAVYPALKAAAQRKLSPEDLVLAENEEENTDCDAQVRECFRVSIDACGRRVHKGNCTTDAGRRQLLAVLNCVVSLVVILLRFPIFARVTAGVRLPSVLASSPYDPSGDGTQGSRAWSRWPSPSGARAAQIGR